MPKVEALALPGTVVRDFLEEIQAHVGSVTFPEGYAGPTLQTASAVLAKKYASVTAINTTAAVMSAMQYCLQIQAMEACTILIRRVVDAKSLTTQYISTVLVPFIPELRRLALQYKMLDGFAPLFQSIMLAWIEKVLGPKPKDDTLVLLSRLGSWACKCTHCSSVRHFLGSSPNRELRLDRIGAPSRKHVEAFIHLYAKSACTYQTISRSPQGLQVCIENCRFETLTNGRLGDQGRWPRSVLVRHAERRLVGLRRAGG